MNGISNFLQKFLKIDKDNDIKLLLILDVIKKETGIEVSKGMLEIKGDNIKLNCNPVFRNEIFMHQSQIEESLKQRKVFLKLI